MTKNTVLSLWKYLSLILDYKVDEKELEESICRNKEIIARARAGRGKNSDGMAKKNEK